MDTKECNVCHVEFPATREYFAPNKNGKFGLRPDCKACANKRNAEWREANRDFIRDYAKRYNATHTEQRKEYRKRQRGKHQTEQAKERERLRLEGKRRCCDCDQILPATPEHFSRSPSQPLGIGYRCHACNRINSRKQQQRMVR